MAERIDIPAIETAQLGRVWKEPRRLLQRRPGPRTVALEDVSITIQTGECVALVGPNGAGKSTLLRMLATLVLPSSGRAMVYGHDVADEPERVRRVVGVMLSDDRSFFWPLTALENLTFFAALQRLPTTATKRRALEVLDMVDLADAADRRVSGFSAGMRQRLNIARALLHDPPLLLLDEPTSSLDVEHRGQLIRLLREISRTQSRTMLIATHDAGIVLSLATRVVRLVDGRVVPLSSDRASRSYRLTIAGVPESVSRSLGEAEEPGDGGWAVTIQDLGDGHALGGAIASVVAAGGEVVAVEPIEPQPS
jgi:ABC-2 type transport system ATP-binding protein